MERPLAQASGQRLYRVELRLQGRSQKRAPPRATVERCARWGSKRRASVVGDGVGRAIVANVAAGEDPRIKEWINALPTVSAKLKDPNDLLQSRIGEEEAALTGFALVRFISTGNQRKQFDQLLRQLHNGISFDEAFGGTFGPADLFIRKWLGLPAKR